MIMDDYDGQMIFEGLVGLKLSDICLTGEEKSRGSLAQETCPDRGSNRVRCVSGAHATACSTAVDKYIHIYIHYINYITIIMDDITWTISFKYQVTYRIPESTKFKPIRIAYP